MATKTTGPTTRSYRELPTLRQWCRDTERGRVAGRANDPILRTIDALLKGLQNAEGGATPYLLGQLFLATMSWMGCYKSDPRFDAECRKPILRLNLFAGNDLARVLDCPLAELASNLRQLYGIDLSPHGIHCDQVEGQSSEYMERSEAEKWRVFIISGRLAWCWTSGFRILDTGGNSSDGRAGFGYALSLSNRLHVSPFNSAGTSKVFHSVFTRGRAVQCAGMIQIREGIVTDIKNDSGHYTPPDQALVKMLLFLRTHGMDVSRINVHGMGSGDTASGADFMQGNGNWSAIRARAPHQVRL